MINKTRVWAKEIFEHKNLILASIIFLVMAITLSYYAGLYVNKTGGVVVPDLIISNIPAIDLSFMFAWGVFAILAVFFAYPLFFKVNELHKAIGQFSLLLIIRSIFICFTHMDPPADAIATYMPWPLSYVNFQNDLFFSGHVALTFLGFLIFRDSKIRYFFLISSIVMGIVVLLMHVHYSIDVFSAFFITYGSYKLGEWFFKKINHY